MIIHYLKIEKKDFTAIIEEIKKFEIRKNDSDFEVGNFILLREWECGEYTGNEIFREITFITDYAQKPGYVVMSLNPVPISFQKYIKMSDKEKEVFKIVINHANLYGFGDRDTTNTFWEIIDELIVGCVLTEYDRRWYRNYWNGVS